MTVNLKKINLTTVTLCTHDDVKTIGMRHLHTVWGLAANKNNNTHTHNDYSTLPSLLMQQG